MYLLYSTVGFWCFPSCTIALKKIKNNNKIILCVEFKMWSLSLDGVSLNVALMV